MTVDVERIKTELMKPENEPIRWLLGKVLLNAGDNRLSDDLVTGGAGIAAHWNEVITNFRSLLVEPSAAVGKIASEVKLPTGLERAERDARLRDLYAECAVVLWLNSTRAYRDFEAIPSGTVARPDFRARQGDASVGIEVKNLREQEDIIDVIAQRRWEELCQIEPEKYNFSIRLFHIHHGWISANARSELRQLLDQFPDRNSDSVEQALDGEIVVRVEKTGPPSRESRPEFDCRQALQTTSVVAAGEAELIIHSAILDKDFVQDDQAFKLFFLKVLRKVAEATPKFFSRESEPYDRRLIAFRWELSRPLFDRDYIVRTKTVIETMMQQVDLPLEIDFFYGNPPLGAGGKRKR